MRLSLYAHLQRLSPRFYARTRLGDIVVAPEQRHQRDPARRRGGGAGVGRQRAVPRRQPGHDGVARLAAGAHRAGAAADQPGRARRIYRRRLEGRVAELRQRSADIGSFLIETLQATSLVVASNAQQREQERFRGLNGAFIDALMRMQRVTYFAGGLPGTRAVDRLGDRVLLRRPARDRRHAHARHDGRVPRLSDARVRAGAGADGPVREPGHGARCRGRACSRFSTRRSTSSRRRTPRRSPTPRGELELRRGVARHRSPVARARRGVVHGAARADASRSSAAAASASRRSPISRRGCSIRTPASFASTATISAR